MFYSGYSINCNQTSNRCKATADFVAIVTQEDHQATQAKLSYFCVCLDAIFLSGRNSCIYCSLYDKIVFFLQVLKICVLNTRFRYERCSPGCFTRSVVIQPSSSQHLILCGVNISDFTLHRFLSCCSRREIQNEISECKISKMELSRQPNVTKQR